MALDLNLRIVSAGVIDISAAATQSFTAANLGRGGLPNQARFVVVVTDGTAAAIEPLHFDLEVTVDNGSNWKTVSTIELLVADYKGVWSVPCGLIDLVPEQYAAADIDVRVTARWTTVASADDVTFDAYLAGPQPFKSFN